MKSDLTMFRLYFLRLSSCSSGNIISLFWIYRHYNICLSINSFITLLSLRINSPNCLFPRFTFVPIVGSQHQWTIKLAFFIRDLYVVIIVNCLLLLKNLRCMTYKILILFLCPSIEAFIVPLLLSYNVYGAAWVLYIHIISQPNIYDSNEVNVRMTNLIMKILFSVWFEWKIFRVLSSCPCWLLTKHINFWYIND